VSERANTALLAAAFCTNAAAIGQVTVIGKIVYDVTNSKLDLGLMGLAQFAPALVLVLVAGAVADRLDRRRVLAGGALLGMVVTLGLGAYVGTRPTSVVPIFGLVLVFGVAQAFSAPAVRSLPSDTVSIEDLPRATARAAAAGQAGMVAGPVIGGFLYVANIRLPFAAFAVLLIIGALSALAIPTSAQRSIHTAATPDGGGVHDAMEGLRFVRTQPIIFGAISLDLFAVLFGGAVALLPAIAKDRLGVGAVGLGWLQASTGLGAGAMTLVMATRPLGRHLGRVLLSVVAIFGAFTVALGLTRNYAVAFIAIFALSAADAISVFIRATLVPLATPADKRGRVLAVENVFIGASNELGGFESGVTAQLLGTSGSVLLGGVATVAVAGLWWVLFPALREVDTFPHLPKQSSC